MFTQTPLCTDRREDFLANSTIVYYRFPLSDVQPHIQILGQTAISVFVIGRPSQFPKDNHPYIQFEREYLKLVLEVNTHYNEFVKTFVQIHG